MSRHFHLHNCICKWSQCTPGAEESGSLGMFKNLSGRGERSYGGIEAFSTSAEKASYGHAERIFGGIKEFSTSTERTFYGRGERHDGVIHVVILMGR